MNLKECLSLIDVPPRWMDRSMSKLDNMVYIYIYDVDAGKFIPTEWQGGYADDVFCLIKRDHPEMLKYEVWKHVKYLSDGTVGTYILLNQK